MSIGTGERAGEGLRERKKRQRRAAIGRAALRLFAARGFHATTVADVAAAADVSPRTVFAYFPTKEDLLFADSAEMLEGLATRLDRRPAGESAGQALRAWVGELVEREETEEARCRRGIIDAEVDLRAHERLLLDEVAGILTVALARDLETAPDDVAAQMAGAAAVGALAAIGRSADAHDGTIEERRRDALALVDQAMAFVDGGVRELRRRAGRGPEGSRVSR